MWRSHRAVQSGVVRRLHRGISSKRGAFPWRSRPHSGFRHSALAITTVRRDFNAPRDEQRRWVSQSTGGAGYSNNRQQQRGSSRHQGRAICRSLTASLHELQQELEEIPAQPSIWSTIRDTHNHSHAEMRRDIFQRTLPIVRDLEERIEDETIHPSTKNNQDVSTVLLNVLHLYSECVDDDTDEDLAVFHESQRILDLMERCKLELNVHQCEYAVAIAARANQWEESSDIYWRFIDPDFSGYEPCTISVSNPIGLYAIARAAKEKGIPVVERVFEAVLRMCMVSPSDQAKYVLAAGTAIGYAGEWERLIAYLKTSYDANTLGQPLVAAAMQACLLCDRYDEALDVFDEASERQSAAVEWQWAGESDMVDPLCRDLAMRALGGSTRDEVTSRAQQFLDEVMADDEIPISVEALQGVVSAFEREGTWESAVDCFFSLLQRPLLSARIVSGEELHNLSSQAAQDSPTDSTAYLALVLSRVVRACNSSRKFGVGLLCLHLLSDFVASPPSADGSDRIDDVPVEGHSVKSLSPLFQSSPYADDLLAATMTSLCGVFCDQSAQELYKATVSTVSGDYDFPSSQELYRWLSTESRNNVWSSTNHGWDSALQQMEHILSACSVVRTGGGHLSPFDLNLLSSAVASFVRISTHFDEPEMGIYLGTWVESALARPGETDSHHGLFSDGMTAIPLTDSYLSSAIAAFGSSGKLDVAVDLSESFLTCDSSASKKEWTLSYQETVKVLLSKMDDSALHRFREAALVRRNPGLVCAAAKGLADSGNWKGVADIYRLALTSGCLSEELSLLAMKSLAFEQKTHGRFRTLRTVVEEAAKLSGTFPQTWLESKYWTLKRLIGFSATRRLMWWDDAKTAHLDELELALEVFESRLESGLTPKNRALRTIVSAACSFEEGFVPADRTELPRVPRTAESWIELVSRVVEVAENSVLKDDPGFGTDVAIALENLGSRMACTEYVMESISRGVQLRQAALDTALEASGGSDSSTFAKADLQMMSDRRH